MNWRTGVGILVAAVLAVTLLGCGSPEAEETALLGPGGEVLEAGDVPDLVGLTAGAAVDAAEATGRNAYTFGGGLHAYTPGAAPGMAGSAVTTYSYTDDNVYIAVATTYETTPTVENPGPWWFEGHSGTVRVQGLHGCFLCHGEPYCTACHEQHDVDIIDVQRMAVREELPYEVFRPIAVMGSPFVLRETGWSYEDEPTFTLEGPVDEELAREAILLTIERVFKDQKVTPRVFYEFVEKRQTEVFLRVEISQEAATGVDWEAVTTDELPDIVDAYEWK